MANHFTLNNIKDLLDLYVQNNLIIKRFGFGVVPDVEEMISDNQTFPVLYANLIDVQYPYDNLKTFNFNILVFDLLKNDKSNEKDVWSDSIQVGEDLIRFLNFNANNYYQVIGQPRIETFTERFTDFVAGVNLNISISVDSNLQNDCGIAENNFNFSMPSFLASGGTSGGGFDCASLSTCSVFTTLQSEVAALQALTYNYLPLSGGTVSGTTNFNNGAIIQSGGTDLYNIFLTTADGNDITRVQPGLNTYTGGTGNLPTVNISGLTIDNITVSGSSSFQTLSATTYYSGSTPLQTIIGNAAGLTVSSTTINNGSNNAVLFQSGTTLYEDGNNFVWDNTNKRLGIGIASPDSSVHIKGVGSTSATMAFNVDNSSNTHLFNISNDGKVGIGNTTPTSKLHIIDNTVTTGITQSISSTGLTSGSLLNISSTSTSITTNTGLLNVSYAGTPASGGTTYAIYADNNSLGNNGQTRVGVRGGVSGGSLFTGGGTGIGGLFTSTITGNVSYGVQATISGQVNAGAYGVYGSAATTGGASYGVYGVNTGNVSGSYGTYGSATSTNGATYGAYGIATTTLNGGGSYGGRFRGVANTSNGSSVSYGVYGEALTTGTGGLSYAGYFTNIGASATNIGGYFNALNGTTFNYALLVENGSVGLGTITPTAKVHIKGAGSTSATLALNIDNSSNAHLVTVRNDKKFAIGTDTFSSTNPQTFLVSAGTSDSTFNLIEGNGTLNNYLQFNIKNQSSGTSASSDIVATANNGDENNGFIDFGINNSGYTGNFWGNANDGYLYVKNSGATGGNLIIGTSDANKAIIFNTSGATSDNEKMRITDSGVGIGTSTPNSTLQVSGSTSLSYVAKTANYTATTTDYTIDCTSGSFTITLPTAVGITGRIYNIKNTGTGVITVATTSSQTIDGATTATLNSQYQSIPVQSTGSGWIIL